jgi:hypothetical protein
MKNDGKQRRNAILGTILAAFAILGACPESAKAADAPVAMATPTAGNVEIRRGAAEWKPLTRNAWLFPGDSVRSSSDGSIRFALPTQNVQTTLSGAGRIDAGPDGELVPVEGTLSAKTPATGDLAAGIAVRFAESQRYTTVRRGTSAAKENDGAPQPPRSVAASPAWPEIVAQSPGAGIAVAAIVDDKRFETIAGDEPAVRIKLSGLAPGRHSLAIETTKNGVVARSEKLGTLVWLSENEERTAAKALADAKTAYPNDGLVAAAVLEDSGLLVPAMDAYSAHLDANPDDAGMRPLLVRVYAELRLNSMRAKEVERLTR